MKNILIAFYLIPVILFSQNDRFLHELSDIHNLWHAVELTDEVLSEISPNLSDIRILSVSETLDTNEVGYFLKNQNVLIKKIGSNFSIINLSEKNGEYYWTFKIKDEKILNEIVLDFSQENFNWNLELEASQDQKEWKTILKNYRILAIQNSQTSYKYTTLKFPNSQFFYYRIHFKSNAKPNLKSASLRQTFERENKLQEFENSYIINNNKKRKETTIDVTLDSRLPISQIGIEFSDNYDFQRPVTIKYLSDSFKTENGMRYSYRNITNSYVSSIENNNFSFDAIFSKKFQIIIRNNDNQTLTIKDINTKVHKYELVARFLNTENTHYLTYGDKEKRHSVYDVINFQANVPEELELVTIGKQVLLQNGISNENSVFDNTMWLWAIIILIIALLGYSSLSMLKTKKFAE